MELASSEDLSSAVGQIPEVLFQSNFSPDRFTVDCNESFVVGPGLGQEDFTGKILSQLLRAGAQNVILDADALNFYAAHEKSLGPLPSSWILTPHVGELARLLKISNQEVSRDRIKSAINASQKLGCIVLLKGYRTVVSDGQKTFVILSGNVALAKAGSGDVLSGFIGGLRAQGLPSIWSACLGAYIHGKLADDWVESGRDVISLVPSDLFAMLNSVLPKTIRKVRTRQAQ